MIKEISDGIFRKRPKTISPYLKSLISDKIFRTKLKDSSDKLI